MQVRHQLQERLASIYWKFRTVNGMLNMNRDQLRGFYVTAWKKHRQGQPLQPLESQLVQVINDHPEYHAMLEKEDAVDIDFPHTLDQNPFLHMGLHLAINDQLATGRPAGLREIFQQLIVRSGGEHAAAHRVQQCLGEALWKAQQSGVAPDEEGYLTCLRRMAGQR